MPKRVREQTIPDQAQEWMPSVVGDKDLQLLVDRGLLPPKELGQWKSAYQNPFPPENPGETIVYTSFFERGLGLPTSKFLRRVLYFYRIQLVNLTPKGLSQIAFFVHMCEAFLGIDPHFQLFRYFFRLKPQPDNKNPNICGGAVFQLRQDKIDEYFGVPLKNPKRTWRNEWFIIKNKVPQVHECTRRKPVFSDIWNSSPNNRESTDIPQLVEMIAELKRNGLTGVEIAYSFTKLRIQPLQERSVLDYEYKGPEDPRLKEDLTHEEILERLHIFFGPVKFKPKISPQYSAGNFPQEHIASYYFPAPLPEHLTREEESRGKGFAHQSDSDEPAEEELQVPVLKKRIVVRKIRVSRIPNLPDAELAHVSAPPQPEPVASSDETHPEATLVEKVGITEAEDELTQMLKTQEKLTDFAKSFLSSQNAQDQLYQALQREETLKGQLESERNACKLADSQLNVSLQRIQDLNARLEKAEAVVEEIKAKFRVFSDSVETQASIFLDHLRELVSPIRLMLDKYSDK